MRWSTRVALLAGSVAGVAAPALAALYVAANDGFGAGDIPAFGLWSAFLAVLVGTLARPVLRHAGRRRRAVARCLAGLAGLGVGVLFTATVALAMGPVVGAFSFPILYLWAAAGAVGMVAAAVVLPAPPEELHAPPLRLRRILGAMVLVLLLVVAVPIVLFYGSALVWGRAEPTVHLVPSGYEGPVVIIYGDSGGAPEHREGKTRVYDIPPGGVLRTRFAANPGWSAPDYFYVDSGGRRTPIVRGAPCADSLPGDPVQACLMPVMWTMSMSVGDSVTPAPPQPEYESYVVGRQANRRELEARWDSVVHWAVFGDSSYRTP